MFDDYQNLACDVTGNGRVRLPVSLRTDRAFLALDLQLAYDARELCPASVRGAQGAAGALVDWNESEPGKLSIALASAARLGTDGQRLLVVEFTTSNEYQKQPIRGLWAAVDDESASLALAPIRKRR
jgi:hypothetical protein